MKESNNMKEYNFKLNLESIIEAKDIKEAARNIEKQLCAIDNLMRYVEIEQVDNRTYEEILADEKNHV
tara:strand:+ start:297 stop:500 length:204 start_codon:yes stop_codon:yes gene_type:complete